MVPWYRHGGIMIVIKMRNLRKIILKRRWSQRRMFLMEVAEYIISYDS